ncbi:prepilin-type N-terminal cleavage/methylation domain-containing protein [Desulfurobacterium pacificum]|uniref:Prepilin-type N-terminal cleavage/methylation domain-containing protein n=1 Tax=Desulfurobacterium pacificum TaxID=240166 RepID=A0ABY1NLA4_9BACT|nr:prepilin-type N-terminal cleavage/methylation domain-containing protein [Desulfurobacterium pacificum]SMP12483.1 prepilin-type N-terminal cleavage/methylation domain-containing protein [Desulfurobacterium pacificum]
MKKEKILNRKGFSLVELAIVLIITGLIMGVGIKSCISGITTAKIDKTKDNLNTLSIFIQREICKYGKYSFSIPENLLTDGWNRKIKVLSFGNLTSDPVCSIPDANTAVNLYNDTLVTNVAFLLLSPGENGKIDSLITTNPIIIKEDDIAEIITLYQLKANCCNSYKLQILTSFLPPITEGETYNTTLVVKNGSPPYTFSLTSDNPTFNSIINTHFPVKTNNNYCFLNLSTNETESIVQNTLSSEIGIKLKVTDRLGNSAEKTFYITLIKRNLR